MSASHTINVLSALPETMCLPSGLYATLRTEAEWRFSVWAVLAGIEDADDVRMGQLGHQLRLPLETFHAVGALYLLRLGVLVRTDLAIRHSGTRDEGQLPARTSDRCADDRGRLRSLGHRRFSCWVCFLLL